MLRTTDSPTSSGTRVKVKGPRILFRAILALVLSSGFALIPSPSGVSAHGGGLDSNGGHNCRVGSCAGTYHCHRAWGPRCQGGNSSSGSGSSSSSSSSRPSSSSSRPKITPAKCVRTQGSFTYTGAEIALIQAALKFWGWPPGPIDGIYGSKTRSALNRFERAAGITQSTATQIPSSSVFRLWISC